VRSASNLRIRCPRGHAPDADLSAGAVQRREEIPCEPELGAGAARLGDQPGASRRNPVTNSGPRVSVAPPSAASARIPHDLLARRPVDLETDRFDVLVGLLGPLVRKRAPISGNSEHRAKRSPSPPLGPSEVDASDGHSEEATTGGLAQSPADPLIGVAHRVRPAQELTRDLVHRG